MDALIEVLGYGPEVLQKRWYPSQVGPQSDLSVVIQDAAKGTREMF